MPSHLYSFSFAPGHHWSRRYAPQAGDPHLPRGDCARDFGITPHLRLGTEVTDGAASTPRPARWTLSTDGGERHEFDVLVTACGQLTRPAIPPLPGHRRLRRAGVPLGRVGPRRSTSRASAWPWSAPARARSSSSPRSPRSPARRRSTSARRRGSCRSPTAPTPSGSGACSAASPLRVAASRLGLFAFFEIGHLRLHRPRRGARRRFASSPTASADRQLGDDPELLAKATPDYEIGCKRVLFTSDWYPTLRRDDVELVTGGVERVTRGRRSSAPTGSSARPT